MYRRANRASFLRKTGSSCLSDSYGKLVALEILLKDHLGAVATAGMNHDLPRMLNRLAAEGLSAVPPIPAVVLNSKVMQLSNKLRMLSCSAKDGSRITVPPTNYPFIRYIYHEYDGTHVLDVKERELVDLAQTVNDILALLAATYRVVA